MSVGGTTALVVVFLAYVLATKAALYFVGERRGAWPLATIAFAVVTAKLTAATANVVTAVYIGGAIAAAVAAILWRMGPRGPVGTTPKFRPHLWVWPLLLVLLTLVMWATWDEYLFDEEVCHIPVANVIARGLVPPRYPWLPASPLPYHYGFNVLVAAVMKMTNISVIRAIDVVTSGCFFLLLGSAWTIGHRLAARLGASLAILLVPLGSGTLSYFVQPGWGAMQARWSVLPTNWFDHWTDAVPPPIANFFQHPVGLAMPVTIAILLLWTSERPRTPRRFVLAAFFLGALSLANITYFAVVGLALGVTAVAWWIRDRNSKMFAIELASLLGALGLAFAIGGFLVASSNDSAKLIFGKPFFEDGVLLLVLRHLALFGLPFVAVFLAPARFMRGAFGLRVALCASAIVGFVIPNMMTYDSTWDIVKFFGVGCFVGNVLLADLLAAIARRRGWITRLVTVVAVLFAMNTSVAWLLRYSVFDGRYGVPRQFQAPPLAVAEAIEREVGHLIRPDDFVMSSNMDVGRGGFLTPGVLSPPKPMVMVLDYEEHKRLYDTLRRTRHSLLPEDLDTLGVKWLVLSPGDEAAMSPDARERLQDPEHFERVANVKIGAHTRNVYRRVADVSAVTTPRGVGRTEDKR